MTLANVVVSDNHTGIRSTDGHFLELEAGCRIEDNDIGVESSDHGSLEINAPVSFCGNGVASLRSVRNSWITIDGDVASCVFCVGDGSVEVETLSSVQGTPCADLPPCTVTPPGTGFCIGARLPDHLTSQYLLYTIFVSYNLWGRR